MRRAILRSYCALLAVSAGLGGCAIHPLPEDYAPLNTVEIVHHIRCEMYGAMREQIIMLFEWTGTEAAKVVADDIRKKPKTPLGEYQSKVKLLSPEYQRRIDAFKATAIGYGFRFNITEQDVAKSEVNFGLPWNPLSNFTLKATGTLDKKRTNTRRFIKVDSFEELLLSEECLGKPLNAPNIAYPITGTIGLASTVDTFFKLATSGARTKYEEKEIKNFSEQLTFTTEISGSINPKVKLSPLTDHFKVADAGVDLSAKRTDFHEVTITFDVEAAAGKRGVAALTTGRNAVVNELNQLRYIDAIERIGTVPAAQ